MIHKLDNNVFFKDGFLYVDTGVKKDFSNAGKPCGPTRHGVKIISETHWGKPSLKSGDHVVIAEEWQRMVSEDYLMSRRFYPGEKIRDFSTMPESLFSQCPQYKITGDCLGVKETFSPRAIDEAMNNKFGPTVNKKHYFKYPATEVEG